MGLSRTAVSSTGQSRIVAEATLSGLYRWTQSFLQSLREPFEWIMADKEDLRQQMIDAFGGADYPISSPMDLVPTLPNGPSTTFESGNFSMTAMELNTKLSGGDFPYDSAEAFVDDIVNELEKQDLI